MTEPDWDLFEAVRQLATLEDCYRFAVTCLRRGDLSFKSGMSTPEGEAAFLIAETLRLSEEELEAFARCRLTRREREAALGALHERLSSRRPMAYILGATWYCGHRLLIDEGALIPRSAIGTMLEDFFQAEPIAPEAAVLELGTGSGAIAIAFAHAFPEARICASELSEPALALAAKNLALHGLSERVELRASDLFAAFAGRRFDWILFNPPYVSEDFKEVMTPEYGYEPEMALFGGGDGLAVIREALRSAPQHLSEGGRIVMEMGDITGERFRAEYPGLACEWYCHPESGAPVVLVARREDLEGSV